ncbi:MAG TPA: tripartite tricarboxylate transporter substrate binding protein [Burkholderiales bacterium]|nr:tripartite tricarboxylate transporter substrate binding protein [Burkholderiales bacterium]
MKSECLLTALVLGLALPVGAPAQGYPARPVRVVVPLVPGGNLDIVARAVGQRLGEGLGQQVIVENRPGASSLVGTQYVAKAAPDGYTLLAMANTFTAVPAVIANPGYDPVKDFTGVTMTCKVAQVLVINPSLPVRSVKELVALAKARPGELSYASSGNGSTGHFAAELFNQKTGLKMLHVPYKGNAQAIVDIIAGQVMMMYDQVSTSAPLVKAGKLRALAVTSSTRSSLFPDLPTISEAGVKGYEAITFNGLLAPAGTPRDALARLQTEVAKAIAAPALRNTFLERGVELTASGSPEEFSSYIRSEVAANATLARNAGIVAQ